MFGIVVISLGMLLYSRHGLMFHFVNQIVLGFSIGYFIASIMALIYKSEYFNWVFAS